MLGGENVWCNWKRGGKSKAKSDALFTSIGEGWKCGAGIVSFVRTRSHVDAGVHEPNGVSGVSLNQGSIHARWSGLGYGNGPLQVTWLGAGAKLSYPVQVFCNSCYQSVRILWKGGCPPQTDNIDGFV